MQKKSILAAIAAITLMTLACGFTVNLPIETVIKTGPTDIKEIRVPELDNKADIAEITLAFGAGELHLSSGAIDALVEGTASYNVFDLKPKIEINDNRVQISNGSLEINGIPSFNEKLENTWKLNFGADPIDLSIKAGAYKGEFDLGGLNLTNLHITDGAADVELDFSTPNLTEMRTLRYESGASNIEMTNLGNAHFSTLIFQGGAGNYELDFSGDLLADTKVFIETGLSSITLTVPADVNVQLKVEGGLASVSPHVDWEGSGSRYSLDGEGPTLTIDVEMGAGNLDLRNP
jgi:hypothetical protein